MAKVLLIEDDPAISRLYQRSFTLEDFEIELADNGLSGLEQLPVFQPDIILLDIMMPSLNGLEFLTQLKQNPASSHIPVVVLTNVSDTNIQHLALSKGASLFLIKSQTDPDDVVAAVRGVLAKQTQTDDAAATDSGQSDAPANPA